MGDDSPAAGIAGFQRRFVDILHGPAFTPGLAVDIDCAGFGSRAGDSDIEHAQGRGSGLADPAVLAQVVNREEGKEEPGMKQVIPDGLIDFLKGHIGMGQFCQFVQYQHFFTAG